MSQQPISKSLRIAIVGPCTSGKSTLRATLRQAGYEARHPVQEHSGVPTMWKRRVNPDVLIFLDVSAEALLKRRPHQTSVAARLPIQHKRLAHARQHTDLYIDTSALTIAEVAAKVFSYLKQLES